MGRRCLSHLTWDFFHQKQWVSHLSIANSQHYYYLQEYTRPPSTHLNNIKTFLKCSVRRQSKYPTQDHPQSLRRSVGNPASSPSCTGGDVSAVLPFPGQCCRCLLTHMCRERLGQCRAMLWFECGCLATQVCRLCQNWELSWSHVSRDGRTILKHQLWVSRWDVQVKLPHCQGRTGFSRGCLEAGV